MSKEKQTEVKIESVSNGWIVKEDYFDRHPDRVIITEQPKILVFNEFADLSNYLKGNLRFPKVDTTIDDIKDLDDIIQGENIFD